MASPRVLRTPEELAAGRGGEGVGAVTNGASLGFQFHE